MTDRERDAVRVARCHRTHDVGTRQRKRFFAEDVFLCIGRADDLVCVVGEANAWPYHCQEREAGHPDELVHWVARRLSTGETLEGVLAPRNPLGPRTAEHLELPAEALRGGEAVAAFLPRWRAFLRDTDVLCSWGQYGTGLFSALGGPLPVTQVDVRQLARDASGGKVGTQEAFLAGLGAAESPRFGAGRAGLRLGELTEITRRLIAW